MKEEVLKRQERWRSEEAFCFHLFGFVFICLFDCFAIVCFDFLNFLLRGCYRGRGRYEGTGSSLELGGML